MKHLFLVVYIFIIIFCQILLYRSRKPLFAKDKQRDVNLWSFYDVMTLSLLLAAYLTVYFFPYPKTLWIYGVVALLIGIGLQIHYYKRSVAASFPLSFRRKAMISLILQYYSTVTLGFGLIILYNLA